MSNVSLICCFCKLQFQRKYDRDVHERLTTCFKRLEKRLSRKSRKFNCYCGKSYTTKFNLGRHHKKCEMANLILEDTQTSSRKKERADNFRCYCDKNFSTNYSLRRHSEKCQIVEDISRTITELMNTTSSSIKNYDDTAFINRATEKIVDGLDEIQNILDHLTEKEEANRIEC